MGACGCSEFTSKSIRIAGADNKQYIVTPYASCRYCETSTGVLVDTLSRQDASLFDVMHLREPIENDIQLVDLDILKKRFKNYLEDFHGDDAEEITNELIWECLIPAVNATIYRQNEKNCPFCGAKPSTSDTFLCGTSKHAGGKIVCQK